ncbi:MAG: NADP-dependent phosphogluconate dehydrogenase [Chloroflexi bacterium]|nr:NADP-dependent phosphogluconate dehydrogenase [Chloroflexota bacterium]MDA8218401.1 NADP-dependent phosphogluconate dehydrogenase [Dehalococcoidales bacterium]
MNERTCEIGVVGLGVMGRNLALNVADHGFPVAVYNRDPSKLQFPRTESEERAVRGAHSLEEMADLLRPPRAVLMMVSAGSPVDEVISELLPYVAPGDLIIDGGNSFFADTDSRAKALAEKGIHYMGVGISGGEYGARHGPSIMPGGTTEGYERVRPIFEAIAAQVNDEPCVAYLGPGSAGHYVKMMHNGIEYGLMQLISECYDLMKRGLGMGNDDLHAVFDRWNAAELNGYLMEITAQIFLNVDEKTGRRLIDLILDKAKQKGTGEWASQDAMRLRVPTPTIDTAVAVRNLSALKDERLAANNRLQGPTPVLGGKREEFLERLRDSLYAAVIITYAQGMAQLRAASLTHGYRLALEDVAKIWRGGCIIRAALLEKIRDAFRVQPDLANLLVDPYLGTEVEKRQEALRKVVGAAAEAGIPTPALMASLAYFDGYRSAWLPANLVQAQRDYFGAHTYERVDAEGAFHTEWTVD